MSEATISSIDARRPALGLIVNPIAGMGGRLGLKGTDGPARLRTAIEREATATAGERAGRALARIVPLKDRLSVCAAAGPMGGTMAEALRLETTVVDAGRGGRATTAEDTRKAAAEMAARGVDLLLFAGGDGTARDILDATAGEVPVLGVPAGVKMYSGAFARSPEAAGDATVAYLGRRGTTPRLRAAEVVDLDEDSDWRARALRIYGRVWVPAARSQMLGAKAGRSVGDEVQLDALAAEIVAEMEPDRLYILGPGTTVGRVRRALGMEDRLLCVDAVRDGKPVGLDLGEAELLELIGDAPATVLAGVIGGQGSLFGRGNQQISAAVLKRVGADHVTVLCGEGKLLALDPMRLHVDTGEASVDGDLCGFRPVRVAPGRSVVVEVRT
ncbi:MAG: NAD(+)/NADH kinase [Actinobacteria bacterium]|nr:NAD(+)/NADH kinase [Actinomycetota bacterium]